MNYTYSTFIPSNMSSCGNYADAKEPRKTGPTFKFVVRTFMFAYSFSYRSFIYKVYHLQKRKWININSKFSTIIINRESNKNLCTHNDSCYIFITVYLTLGVTCGCNFLLFVLFYSVLKIGFLKYYQKIVN